MAACWKVSWKVDPLPLSVPVSLVLLPDVLLGEELQAAIETAVTPMASAAVVTRWTRRCCMLNNSNLRLPQAPDGGACLPARIHVAIADESRLRPGPAS